MIRQPEREQLNRLIVKTLDQVFVMRAKEGLGCSQFEAEALTNLVKEVCFSWLSQQTTAFRTYHAVVGPLSPANYRGLAARPVRYGRWEKDFQFPFSVSRLKIMVAQLSKKQYDERT